MPPHGWPWIARRRSTLFVAMLDIVLICMVIGAGLHVHGSSPITEPGYALRTIAPFVLGWSIVAPGMGAYSHRGLGAFRPGLSATVLAWFLAVIVGGAIRSSSMLPGSAPPIFLAVTIVVGSLVLLPGRTLVILGRKWYS